MNIYNYKCTISSNEDDIKETEVETDFLRRSKVKRGEQFLKGPIPLNDIAAASRISGQALAVLLAVHHQIALTGKPSITLPASLLAHLGVSRSSKSRALKALEQSGLITVARSQGRAARIQLQKTT